MDTQLSLNIDFLIEHVLLNQSSELTDSAKDALSLIKREKVNEPVIFVLGGTSGKIAGINDVMDEAKKYIQESGQHVEIVEVGSIGFTNAEPLMDVQLPGKSRLSFRNVKAEHVPIILDSIFNNVVIKEYVLGQYTYQNLDKWDDIPEVSETEFFKHQNRVLLRNCGIINPFSIEEYIARNGYKAFIKTLYNYTQSKVIDIIDISQLRGRGGGGFPLAKKLKVAFNTPADQKYVICNADESDPGAFMDRALLEGDPHRVVEGIAIAAYAIGASKAYVYLRSEYNIAITRLEKAISDAKQAGLLGHNIFDSGFNLEIFIKRGAGAFVCGEETALINSIEGKRGMPRPRPPYPAESGLYKKPTLINNIETLANIPDIIEFGPTWFTATGTNSSKGTKIFSLSGDVRNTGLIEVSMGTKLSDVIENIGGGIRNYNAFKAMQLGGPTGVCIADDNIDVSVDFDELEKIGAYLGSGGMVVFDQTRCMVDVAQYFLQFIHKESCGKCIPCREGSVRILEILESITRRPDKDSKYETLGRFKGVTQLENLASVMKSASLCGLGKSAANPILSTMNAFREEYEEHIFERHCRAGQCKGLKKYFIELDKCVGCGACMVKCPADAVVGSKKQKHYIVEEKCIGCGLCFEACKFSAIYSK